MTKAVSRHTHMLHCTQSEIIANPQLPVYAVEKINKLYNI